MASSNTNQGEWYTIRCGAYEYTLPIRYQDLVHVGNGAFGAVIRATDTVTGKYVAIKKMLCPFQTDTHARRTYRELKLLIHLNHHDAQIIQLYNVFTPEKSLNEFQTLYFVFNFVDYDLHKVIRRSSPFTEDHIRLITYSLLRGLKFLHSAGIMHRDLKPQNIGIDLQSNVAILDFGLARSLSNEGYTTYVATRWWRAPEVYINEKKYRDKIDLWSVGCVMAELILRRTLFPGLDSMDQLTQIISILGTPDAATLDEICTPAMRITMNQLPLRQRQDFNQLFGFKYDAGTTTPTSGVSPQGVDLLGRLLSFDYRARPTAEEALAHPFFETLHDPMDEPTSKPVLDEHEGQVHSTEMWKSIIWQMVQEFVPPSWIVDNSGDDA